MSWIKFWTWNSVWTWNEHEHETPPTRKFEIFSPKICVLITNIKDVNEIKNRRGIVIKVAKRCNRRTEICLRCWTTAILSYKHTFDLKKCNPMPAIIIEVSKYHWSNKRSTNASTMYVCYLKFEVLKFLLWNGKIPPKGGIPPRLGTTDLDLSRKSAFSSN